MHNIFWVMGLSGSGKTTLTNMLAKELFAKKIYFLDNDFFRKNIIHNNDFSKESRIRNVDILRNMLIELSNKHSNILLNKITPYENEIRNRNRNIFSSKGIQYYEIYCKCPVSECIKRDVKGLYKKAMNGKIQHMIGISTDKDDIYETPLHPDLVIDTTKSIEECYKLFLNFIRDKIC